MDFEELQTRMRRGEAFHQLRVLDGLWIILRIDGRNFSRFTRTNFQKPFDELFHQAMVGAAQRLLLEFSALYVYTQSDEISVLLGPSFSLFDREVEKLISLSASTAASSLSLSFQKEVQCDSRLWVGVDREAVLDYFQWRLADCSRCCLNGWCYWILRQQGATAKQATAQLKGQSFSWKNEFLHSHSINFNEVPLWQRRGSGLYRSTIEKIGFNPMTGQKTSTTRRQVQINTELPMGESYRQFLDELL